MLSMRFTAFVLVGVTILTTLQPIKAADQDLYILAGDISNFYVSDIFNRNVIESKKSKNLRQIPATYTSTNPQAARISSVREVNADYFPGGASAAKDCTYARAFQLATTQDVYLTCEQDEVHRFTLGQDNTLTTVSEARFDGIVNDFQVVDTTNGDYVSLNIQQDAPNYYFGLTLQSATVVQRTIDQTAWEATAIKSKAAIAIWQFTDGQDPPTITPFWVGYQRETNLASTTSANYILWAKSDADETGRVILNKASNFPDDATLITDLSFNDQNTMIVVYKSAGVPELQVAECIVAYATQAVTITSCTKAATGVPSITAGSIVIRQTTSGQAGIATVYKSDTKEILVADYDAGAFTNYGSSNVNIIVSSTLEFLAIRTGTLGTTIQFAQKGTTTVITTLYNIVRNGAVVTYDQTSDRLGVTSTSVGNRALLLKQRSYSVWTTDDKKIYVSLIADQFTAGSQEVTITKTEGPDKTNFIFGVNVITSLASGAAIRSLPDYQDYNRDSVSGNKLAVNRRNFFGNNLDFKFSLEGFDVLNANSFSLDVTGLGTQVWLQSFKNGLGITGNKVNGLTCTGTVLEKNFACQVNENITYDIPAGATLVHLQSVSTASESGAILISTDATDTHVAYIDFNTAKVNVGKITGIKAVADQVFFNIVGVKFVFWFLESRKVTLQYSDSKALTSFSSFTIDSTLIGKNTQSFCPTSIEQNASSMTLVEVMSNCDNGESRLWRFDASDVTAVKVAATKLFANPQIGVGAVSFCSFGQEYLALNPANGFLFSADIEDDNSINNLGQSMIGYTSVKEIVCTGRNFGVFAGVDGTGDKWMSVVYGNRLGDLRDRYHSSVKYTGTIEWVTSSEDSLIVATNNAGTYQFFSILLKGPIVYYNGAKQTGAQDVTLQLNQFGTEVASKVFSFSATEFEEKIDSKPKEGADSKTVKGSYKIFDIADINGPIFNIKIQKTPEVTADITIDPQYTKDGEYAPTQTTSPEPQRIVTEGSSSVGIYTAGDTLQFYYYQNYDSFQAAIDVGKKSSIADAAINNDEQLIAAYSSLDNGVFSVRGFLYTFASQTPKDFEIVGDFQSTHIVVERISSQKYVVVALNTISDIGKAFTIDIGTQAPTEVGTFSNIDSVGIFAAENTDIIILYSDVEDSTLRSVAVNAANEIIPLTTAALQKKIAINEIKCRAFKTSPTTPSCIITHNGNFVSDIIVQYDATAKSLTFQNERQYFYFEDYLPIYIDFNEEYVIMKSRNGAKKEAMMFYRRSTEASNELFWGLEPSEYYNVAGDTTNSVPLIFTSGTGETAATNYRFTQNISATQKKLSQTPQNPFSAVKMQDVQLVLGADLTAEQAANVTIAFNGGKTEGDKINILKIFKEAAPEPTPPPEDDDGVPWWVWVIIGMVVFLILVTLLLKFLTKTKDDAEEEDVYYGSEGKAKPDEEE